MKCKVCNKIIKSNFNEPYCQSCYQDLSASDSQGRTRVTKINKKIHKDKINKQRQIQTRYTKEMKMAKKQVQLYEEEMFDQNHNMSNHSILSQFIAENERDMEIEEINYIKYLKSVNSLSQQQKLMLAIVNCKAYKNHQQCLSEFKEKYRRLNIEQKQAINLLYFIQSDAPITISFNAYKSLPILIKEHIYRGKKNQSYIQGQINIYSINQGCNTTNHSEQSYFQLKNEVRMRSFLKLKKHPQLQLTTLKYGVLMMNELPISQLQDIIGSMNQQKSEGIYKEVRIMGQIDLFRDVQKMFISQNQLRTDSHDFLEAMKKRYGFDYQLF